MYVCTYVCMYLYMYASLYACTYVCMHVCMYVCTFVRLSVCLHVCMYACVYVCTSVRLSVCMNVHMFVCLNVCTQACMYVLGTYEGIGKMCAFNLSPLAVSSPRESTVWRMISKESSFNSRRADPVAISLRGCPFVKISLISYAFNDLRVIRSHNFCTCEITSSSLALALACAIAGRPALLCFSLTISLFLPSSLCLPPSLPPSLSGSLIPSRVSTSSGGQSEALLILWSPV